VTAPLKAEGGRGGAPALASVTAGGVDTEYLRCGRGPALVLLTERGDGAWTGGVVQELSRDFLVLAPRRPPGVTFADWLAGFLDGLGITRATIVAEGSELAPALAFADADSLRVARVAVLLRGATDLVPPATPAPS